MSQATKALKATKIANSIALILVDGQVDPLKSGWSKEDVLVEFIDQVCKQLSGRAQLEEDKCSMTEDEK